MMRTMLTVLVVAIGSFAFLYLGYEGGARTVQAAWDSEKAAIVTALREKEQSLQANMDKLRKEKNNELARLNRHVRALSVSLRNRPERPSIPAVPASASAGDGAGGCTGAGLYKPDGEFLIREATRSATLRLALITCQDAYQDAVDKSAGRTPDAPSHGASSDLKGVLILP